MGRLIGYARVSTADQDLQLQTEALQHAGCRDDQIFRDIASGARTACPGLEACVQALAPGDTLVVGRLDRLGRSMVHLVTVMEELLRRQVGFRSCVMAPLIRPRRQASSPSISFRRSRNLSGG